MIGLPERQVTTNPPVLALFPESTGRLTVNLGLPCGVPGRAASGHRRGPLPAGRDRPGVPRSGSAGAHQGRHFRLVRRPEVVRAHRTGRFVVTVTNSGNVRLEVSLAAADPEKVITPRVTPERLLLEPVDRGDVLVEIRGPRMILGSEVDRPSR